MKNWMPNATARRRAILDGTERRIWQVVVMVNVFIGKMAFEKTRKMFDAESICVLIVLSC